MVDGSKKALSCNWFIDLLWVWRWWFWRCSMFSDSILRLWLLSVIFRYPISFRSECYVLGYFSFLLNIYSIYMVYFCFSFIFYCSNTGWFLKWQLKFQSSFVWAAVLKRCMFVYLMLIIFCSFSKLFSLHCTLPSYFCLLHFHFNFCSTRRLRCGSRGCRWLSKVRKRRLQMTFKHKVHLMFFSFYIFYNVSYFLLYYIFSLPLLKMVSYTI